VEGQHAFLIPGAYTKNGVDRIVFCNSTAWSVIEAQRGVHPKRVFTYEGKNSCSFRQIVMMQTVDGRMLDDSCVLR